jgi:hypothetical protein
MGPLIRRLFEEAADVRMTLEALATSAFQRGLRCRRTQGRVTHEGIRRILRNPIYWGPFWWKGQLYQGSHVPLVSKQLFDDAQTARRAKDKPRRSKNSFAFSGMVSCTCGKRLIGQIVKRRYVYYGCSARCGTALIKESELSARFLEHLKAIQIDNEAAAWILEAVKEFEAQRRQEHERVLAKHQERQRQVQAKIDAAYDDKISGRITEEYWLRRHNEWQLELAEAAAAIRDLENATFDSFKKADALLKLCQRAPDLFVRQTLDEQARLMKFVDSNSTWDGVTLTAQYRRPFDLLAKGPQSMDGGAYGGPYTNFPRAFTRAIGRLPEGGVADVAAVPAAA